MKIKKLPMPLHVAVQVVRALVVAVQVVLQLVVDVAMHVGMIVVAALVHAKETVMVAAVNVAEIVPAHAQIHVRAPVLGHVPIIVKILAQDIVKKHVQLDALLAMVALIAVGAMAHVQSDVTLLVMQVPMHKL